MPNAAELYKVACDAIDKATTDLHQLSDAIWKTPELNFEEYEAHKNLTAFLEKYGFPVQRSYKLQTAFRSDYGTGSNSLAILCEYDALPEIGHACGHNLIAEVGIAASLGVKAALDQAGLNMLTVLGTPAEEGGGGKIDLLKEGAFDDVDCAMMAHPAWFDETRGPSLAIQRVQVRFYGKASHAASAPWEGVNALDAVVISYNAISCFRQQMPPQSSIHGIIVNGGAKPNIIPEYTELLYYVRASTSKLLESLKVKVINCFEAASLATGCKVEMEWNPKAYLEVIHNRSLSETYEKHLTSFGVNFDIEAMDKAPNGSTDMGNIGHVVPSIHPYFKIGTTAVNHTRDFTTAAGHPDAQPYTLTQAKVMAMTAIDIMLDPQLLPAMKDDFRKDMLQRA